MQYNSIISAISRYLKCISVDRSTFTIGLLPTCSLPYYFENIVPNEKCTKIIYNSINKTNVIPTSIPKWKTVSFPHLELLIYVYMMPLKSVLQRQLILQYNGYSLESSIGFFLSVIKKIHIKTDDCCTFCKNESENILHVFFMCEKIMPLWRDFSLHIYRTTRERLGFNAVNIILGEMPLSQSNRVKKFIILLSKQNIFSCLLQNKEPTLCGLLWHIKMKYCIERCVSIHNCKLADFEKQWHVWKNIFESNTLYLYIYVYILYVKLKLPYIHT